MTEADIAAMQQPTLEEVPAEAQGRQDAIAELTSRLQAAETTVAHLAAELEAQRQALAAQAEQAHQREAEAAQLRQALTQSAAKYRGLLLASAPDVPQELVSGTTIEEIDASLAAAQTMVAQIKQRLEAHQAQERVPTGSPPRGAPDLAALSPRDKIAYALSHSQQ